jgi:hypothetical protein
MTVTACAAPAHTPNIKRIAIVLFFIIHLQPIRPVNAPPLSIEQRDDTFCPAQNFSVPGYFLALKSRST